VKLFYSNLYDEIQGLNLIVNAGLALALIGFLFRIYLIASASASLVFWFETTFTVIHIILAIIFTKEFGMFGYAWAVVISRTLRALTGCILALFFVNKREKQALMETSQATA
jgi:O-antigen/teichoic acid export membrane protein